MNKKLLIGSVGFVAAAFAITACVSSPKNPERAVASLADIIRQGQVDNSTQFADQTPARALDAGYLNSLSTQSNLSLADARVIKDNDEAFKSKLETINKARNEIRMVYFIYSDDDSSSVINNALLAKARDGVKVKLLVDFITNYSRFDFFRMMEQKGNGNLTVYYYNFPDRTILEDAKYMTLPCPPKKQGVIPAPNECAAFKAPLMQQLSGQETTAFTRMFLAGLYGKNALSAKVALGYGAQINPDDYKSAKETSDEDKAKLFDFLKLVKDSMTGDIAAKLKLSIAMSSYGETLNPVMNEATGRLPVMNPTVPADREKSAVWDHLTDYTHHKLLVVDGTYFQLGGRNIEDSYHMKSRIKVEGRKEKGKYIFIDTDFWAQAKQPGDLKAMEDSFDRILSAANMVVTSDKVARIIPNEMIQNATRVDAKVPSPAEISVGTCVAKAKAGDTSDLGTCIESGVSAAKGYVGLQARMDSAYAELQKSADQYLTKYKATARDSFKNQPWVDGIDHLSENDLKNAQFNYIENISYDKKNNAKRNKGSRIGAEAQFNKNIHALWYRGIENACYVSRKEKRDQRVVLHTAYLFMPSGLTHKISKMLNGDYGDCSRVRFTLLTNSFETTDLNVINVFARYQMRELFVRYNLLEKAAQDFDAQNGAGRYKRFFPKLEYFEYNASSVGTGISLHTKASILGDDVIIGSANADVRSYYMDTNNGIYIRNAKDLVKDYLGHIDQLTSNRNATKDWSNIYPYISDAQLRQENEYLFACTAYRYDKKGKYVPLESRGSNCKEKKPVFTKDGLKALAEIDAIGARITNDTRRLLDFRREFDVIQQMGEGNMSTLEMEMNKLANDFDDTFKTL